MMLKLNILGQELPHKFVCQFRIGTAVANGRIVSDAGHQLSVCCPDRDRGQFLVLRLCDGTERHGAVHHTQHDRLLLREKFSIVDIAGHSDIRRIIIGHRLTHPQKICDLGFGDQDLAGGIVDHPGQIGRVAGTGQRTGKAVPLGITGGQQGVPKGVEIRRRGFQVKSRRIQCLLICIQHRIGIAKGQNIAGAIHYAAVHDLRDEVLLAQGNICVIIGADVRKDAVVHCLLYIPEHRLVHKGLVGEQVYIRPIACQNIRPDLLQSDASLLAAFLFIRQDLQRHGHIRVGRFEFLHDLLGLPGHAILHAGFLGHDPQSPFLACRVRPAGAQQKQD